MISPAARTADDWLQTAVDQGVLTAETVQNVRRWLEPPYREFHAALLALLERRDVDELTRLFWMRIPFGTGGRRGPMAELGSATMNRRTIAESAFGLATYVRRNSTDRHRSSDGSASGSLAPDDGGERTGDLPRVAIAYDTRLRSREFAEVTACVMAAQGFHVCFYAEPRATPQLSFTVRRLHCDCGVMISASHNPPADNGFKAYWSHGGQVLPPHDRGIIECVEAAAEIPSIDFSAGVENGQIELLSDALDGEYVSAVCALSLSPARTVRALYTPLHGVGESSVFRVLQQAGFTEAELFEPQRTPDGNFPNVPDHLPNPERTAVFGPAVTAAKADGYDLVLASDPDADRLAVAVRQPDGEFQCLTGNQLAALLTDYVLEQRTTRGTLSSHHYVIETLVTTPLVAAIATHYGVDVVRELPVGFKHMAAVVEARGAERFVFATEESVGYMAGDYCRDKDASIGALWTLELAAELRPCRQTLCDRLRELYQRHGVHLEAQVSREFPGPTGAEAIRSLVARLREHPPAKWGEIALTQVRDYGLQQVRRLPDNSFVQPLPVAAGDLLFLDGGADDCRVQIGMRPSGTEPKIKFYLFVQAPADAMVAARSVQCDALLQQAGRALDEWLRADGC